MVGFMPKLNAAGTAWQANAWETGDTLSPSSRQTTPQAAAIPKFTSSAQVANPSGLALHSSGQGLVAAVDNVGGTGYISLPFAIAATDSWLAAIQIEVNDARVAQVQICHEGGDYRSGVALIAATGGLTLQVGGNTAVNAQGNPAVPAGSKVWCVITSDGVVVRANMFVEGQTWDFVELASFAQPLNKWTHSLQDVNFVNSISAFGLTSATKLTRFNISTSSTQNRILQVYAQYGSQVPGAQAPAIPYLLRQQIAGEGTAAFAAVGPYVLVPANYNSANPKIVFEHHPNANPGGWFQTTHQSTILQLLNAGYVVAINTGEYGAGSSSPTSSNWGAPSGLKYRKLVYDWVRNNLPRTREGVYALGLSMGALNSYRFADVYPGITKAIACVSGALDLTDSMTNRGFTSIVQAGYGDVFVCLGASTGNAPPAAGAADTAFWRSITIGRGAPADSYYAAPYVWRGAYSGATVYAANDIAIVPSALGVAHFSDVDPVKNAGRFAGIPAKFWHGSADALIPPAQSQALVTALTAAGGNASLVSVSGGTHLSATMFDPAAIQAFFDAN